MKKKKMLSPAEWLALSTEEKKVIFKEEFGIEMDDDFSNDPNPYDI